MGECKNLTQTQTIILASNDSSLNQGKFQRKLTVKWGIPDYGILQTVWSGRRKT